MGDHTQAQPEVIVLGAGVIGLSTAIRIQEESGAKVVIVAETLPTDPKTIRYTSQWAGAHHASLAGEDVRQQHMDMETFHMMWALSDSDEAEGCFLRVNQTECYVDERSGAHELSVMPDFRWLQPGDLPGGAASGVGFSTITIEPGRYLEYLQKRFLAKGGAFVKGQVQHLAQIAEGGTGIFSSAPQAKPPSAIIVCVGLGARSLGGVEDKNVFPIRGQTILLKAPWVKTAHTLGLDSGVRTYTVPRKSGTLLVGGTKDVNDWYPHPRPETKVEILSRVLVLDPEIVPSHMRKDPNGPPVVEDVLPLVIEEGCGLRPARRDGIRLEVEWLAIGPQSAWKIPVIYNYGHGGYGFQSSWGSAGYVLRLLQGALKDGEVAKDTLNELAAAKVEQAADPLKNSW